MIKEDPGFFWMLNICEKQFLEKTDCIPRDGGTCTFSNCGCYSEIVLFALKFFKDHSIPHTEELIDSYMGAKENRIVWHENVMPFELNINTFEEMHSYTLKYDLIFEIRDDKTLIKF